MPAGQVDELNAILEDSDQIVSELCAVLEQEDRIIVGRDKKLVKTGDLIDDLSGNIIRGGLIIEAALTGEEGEVSR